MPRKPKKVSCKQASAFEIKEDFKAGKYYVGYLMSRIEMVNINNKFLDVPIDLAIPCTSGSRQVGCPYREIAKSYTHGGGTRNVLREMGIILLPVPKLGYKFASPEETMDFLRMKLNRQTMTSERAWEYMRAIKKTLLSKESRVIYDKLVAFLTGLDDYYKKWRDDGLLGKYVN